MNQVDPTQPMDTGPLDNSTKVIDQVASTVINQMGAPKLPPLKPSKDNKKSKKNRSNSSIR